MTRIIDTPSSFPPVVSSDGAAQIEFAQALEIVSRFAVSKPGAASIRRRVPLAAVDAVREELAAVAELSELLESGEAFAPEVVPEVLDMLEQVRVPGSVLEGGQLSEIGQVISAIRNVAAQILRVEANAPRMAPLRVEVPPESLARRLETAIAPDGSVRDGASPDLARARRRLRSTRQRLVAQLENVMHGMSSAVADSGVTQRSSRFVIPVKRESKSRIKGIVHGESSSGATLFVEPHESVQLGNELNACEALESRAVIKVLRDLSDLVRERADEIEEGWHMCVRVDDLYARARYALDVGAHLPSVIAAPAPMIVSQGRHPLLLDELTEVVPFDLRTDDEAVIVVSGPNTGGKTVLLKAVGLIHALAQSGVIPPVGKGTTLPVFAAMYADIGDHQSIAASLSTFSGHLEALKHVLESADPKSLVLLDEFGTGTDPSEGAALAGALLKTLCDRGCLTIATTHLNQLKRLASETPGAVNASLQFDADQLEPTYRIAKGVPGRSYGLAIARRLGFPPEVMALAEELQPEAERSFDALLADLERREQSLLERERTVDATKQRVEATQQGLTQLRGDLADRQEALDHEARRLETVGRAEARRFLLEARKRVEEALGMARAAVNEATAKQARKLVEEGVRGEASALQKLEAEAQKKGWRIRGERRSKTADDAEGPAPAIKRRRPAAVDVARPSAATEIDVRGMTADEAEAIVIRALDDAVVADLASLRIIHGKGTGALRQRVATILSADKRVGSFASPPQQQGGWGVTVAELRS